MSCIKTFHAFIKGAETESSCQKNIRTTKLYTTAEKQQQEPERPAEVAENFSAQ
jgi:hypothetical protein